MAPPHVQSRLMYVPQKISLGKHSEAANLCSNAAQRRWYLGMGMGEMTNAPGKLIDLSAWRASLNSPGNSMIL